MRRLVIICLITFFFLSCSSYYYASKLLFEKEIKFNKKQLSRLNNIGIISVYHEFDCLEGGWAACLIPSPRCKQIKQIREIFQQVAPHQIIAQQFSDRFYFVFKKKIILIPDNEIEVIKTKVSHHPTNIQKFLYKPIDFDKLNSVIKKKYHIDALIIIAIADDLYKKTSFFTSGPLAHRFIIKAMMITLPDKKILWNIKIITKESIVCDLKYSSSQHRYLHLPEIDEIVWSNQALIEFTVNKLIKDLSS